VGLLEENKMDVPVAMDAVYIPSQDIVAREIEGEVIIVPLVSGIGDLEDELFTLNETGKSVWGRLDGKRSVKDVVDSLSEEFEGSIQNIEKDVVGFLKELLKRGIVVEASEAP
jgi:hypothetical protein